MYSIKSLWQYHTVLIIPCQNREKLNRVFIAQYLGCFHGHDSSWLWRHAPEYHNTESLGNKHEALGPYRAPRASTPRSILWTSVCVALFTVWRLVKNFTAQIWEPVAVGPLTDHQSCPHASTTPLGTLEEGQRTRQLFCVNSTWQILFPRRKLFLATLCYAVGQPKSDRQSQGELPTMTESMDHGSWEY